MAQRDESKLLYGEVIYQGRTILDRLFLRPEAMTIGRDPGNTFVISSPTIPPCQALVLPVGDHYHLVLAEGLQGELERGGEALDLTGLASHEGAVRYGALSTFPLDGGCRARVALGEVEVRLELVDPLPPGMGGGVINAINWIYAPILITSLILHAWALLYVEGGEWPVRAGLDHIPERFARFLIVASPEDDRRAKAEAIFDEDRVAKRISLKDRAPTMAERAYRAGDVDLGKKARKARLQKAVAGKGLLKVLGSKGDEGGAIADILRGEMGHRGSMRVLPSSKGRTDQAQRGLFGIRGPSDDGDVSGKILGVLRGNMIGDVAGAPGLAVAGTGRGGGGVGEGTIGLGSLSTIGRGSGYGKLSERPSSAPQVATGSPLIHGSLDKEIIRRVMGQHRVEIKQCYNLAPHLQGKMIVRFMIAPTGVVAMAKVESSTMKDASAVESCITERIRRWRFPAPKGGGVVQVSYPYVFKPAAEGRDKRIAHKYLPRMDNLSSMETVASPPPPPASVTAARAFLAERNIIEDLTFKAPVGYWANTYLPGDPALRMLQAQLAAQSPQDIFPQHPSLRLERSSRQVTQPFDDPQGSALAVYLSADRVGLLGPTRTLVQVGITGTPRFSEHRPAMNVAVVLDLKGALDLETRSMVRALVMALCQAKTMGDRFSLTVAGRPGGLVLLNRKFSHDNLSVVLMDLLGQVARPQGPTLDLAEAIGVATAGMGRDKDAPLGSSMVLVVAPSPIDKTMLARLEPLAHQSAVDGVPLSVIAVGKRARPADLDRLAMAGQGSRSLLVSAADARALVDRELLAVGRAIARAIRLRIRLAPGVKLVNIVDSRSLDEAQSQQVRASEKSIDLKLAGEGIQSDRGEDEEGIQIFIPSFYAGDEHVILLDVVAPGPGEIADVRVRYKDLVFLRNNTARARLSLNRTVHEPGPLELNVVKNMLASRLAQTLAEAGEMLSQGNSAGAISVLHQARDLLQGLQTQLAGLAGDPDLERDITMLEEYSALFGRDCCSSRQISYLADSLRLASRVKVMARQGQ